MRLARIDASNLRVFEFDYDLTFMVFFLDADEQVYARYGGRDAKGPDERQSLAGLRATMESVLAEHESPKKRYAPRQKGEPFFIRQLVKPGAFGGCLHCHQTKEVLYEKLDREGKWDIDLVFRYPLPDNLGIRLHVDRANEIRSVFAQSPAKEAGLKRKDVITSLNEVPIHSFADAQFALDRAPKTGSIPIVWTRAGKEIRGQLKLPEGWRRTDVSWRSSLKNFLASARVYGKDLTAEERTAMGLTAKQLAFRQKDKVAAQAAAAGIRAGDIILGFDKRRLNMEAYDFQLFVRKNYVKGEQVTVNLIRDGKRLNLPMKLH